MIIIEKPSKSKKAAILIVPVILGLSILAYTLIGDKGVDEDIVETAILSTEPIVHIKGDISREQKCEAYRKEIEKKLDDKSFYSRRTKVRATHAINKIFYSPKIDSCLYVKTTTFFKNTQIQSMSLELVNPLTNTTLHNVLLTWGSDDFEIKKKRFTKVVKGYES